MSVRYQRDVCTYELAHLLGKGIVDNKPHCHPRNDLRRAHWREEKLVGAIRQNHEDRQVPLSLVFNEQTLPRGTLTSTSRRPVPAHLPVDIWQTAQAGAD